MIECSASLVVGEDEDRIVPCTACHQRIQDLLHHYRSRLDVVVRMFIRRIALLDKDHRRQLLVRVR